MSQNPWLRLSVVLLLALIARVACGEVASTKRPPIRASRAPSANSDTIEVSNRTGNPVELWVGPGFVRYRSATGFALNFGAHFPLAINGLPIYIGADLGVDFFSRDFGYYTGLNENWVNFQALFTAIYRFDLTKPKILHPYAGFSLGPAILVARGTSAGPSYLSGSETNFYAEFLLRPGCTVDLSRTIAINAEAKFGILGGDLIWIPNAAVAFAL